MAITTTLSNTSPFINYFGMATKLDAVTLPLIVPIPTNGIDYCDLESPYYETVFGSVDTVWWKNDKTRVTVRRYINADTVAIQLFKDDVFLADLNDNTLGIFTNGFTTGDNVLEQQLYVNMELHWHNVFNIHGWGKYQIKANVNIIGVASVWESVVYRLLEFTDKRANKTVRVETVSNGKINGSIFDFTGLNLYSSYRIVGDFIEITENLEINKYKTSQKEWRQIQDKVIENYELRTKMLPRLVTSTLTKEISLANDIKITDYKIMAEELYRRIEVYPINFEKTQLENNRKSIYNIKFTAKSELFIKRNF